MNRNESLLVPAWFLEHIENTLRIENNINIDKKTGETCQDRNIKQALNGVRKLLSGEELTGMERLEPLKPYKAEKDLTPAFEFSFDVPDNDGHIVFTPMDNMTIRKELKLKKGEKVIVSIRKEHEKE